MLYLEGQGDFVSRFITPIKHVVTSVIPILKLLTKSHCPPSMIMTPCSLWATRVAHVQIRAGGDLGWISKERARFRIDVFVFFPPPV